MTASPARGSDRRASGQGGVDPLPDLPLFPTQEIGSLPKTLWRLRALSKEGVGEEEVDNARSEGERLGVQGHEELLQLLSKGSDFSRDEKFTIKQWASRYTLAYLEEVGLDIVYDGEETRTEMYDWPVKHSEGFENRGWVRSWDHLYFKKAAVVSVPECKQPYHLDEYRFASEHANNVLKVPVTGAYTLADWSFDEHYQPHAQGESVAKRRRNARHQLTVDIAKNVLRPNIASLAEAGAPVIQIDEPAATTKPDEIGIFVESFNQSVAGVDGRFSIHICFSDYSLLFPQVLELKNCNQLALELANKDSWELGTTRGQRPGYETLHLWEEYGADFQVGLGVVDVHTDQVEPAELVRDRILYAAEVLGPERVYVNPDCGLRTRRWDVVEAKLKNMVAGTKLARDVLESEV